MLEKERKILNELVEKYPSVKGKPHSKVLKQSDQLKQCNVCIYYIIYYTLYNRFSIAL